MGWAESSKSSLSEKGKCLVSPCQKGRGPFIAESWLDNYKLLISISMKGFIRPVGPDLRRSVCWGRLEASMVFGPILESSRLPLTILQDLHDSGENGAQVGS
jgi:hypothetical protein